MYSFYIKDWKFHPDLSRLTHDDYLDELISDAHRFHYRNIYEHIIDLDEDDDIFKYRDSIKACNGWYQYSDERGRGGYHGIHSDRPSYIHLWYPLQVYFCQ